MATKSPMTVGMVGLGRMGASIARRLLADGHHPVVFDIDPEAVASLVVGGAAQATTLADLATQLPAPRAVWLMVPAGRITAASITALAEVLEPGDTVIDGGNTHYTDDLRHAAELGSRGIHHIDCGTSGGVWGAERGYCLMIGGEPEPVERLDPIFATLAPGLAAAARTPGRAGDPGPEEMGYLHCGPHGAGHFVKMVHNGIEYALMAAYAEGLNILVNADTGLRERDADAETAPMEHPEHYQYRLDVPAVAELWRRGSVVGSWLLDLTAAALAASPGLAEFSGRVSDSGEGRWTAMAAIDEGVPAPVLTAALQSRFDSQGSAGYAHRVMSAMRSEFGGHHEKTS